MTGPRNGGRFPYAIDPAETTGVAMPEIRPKSLPKLLAQGKWWYQRSGEWVRVKDMHPAHRANAARMLLRKAADYAQAVSMAGLAVFRDAPDEVFDDALREDTERTADPEKWMRGTKLYRRLVKGLPDGMRQFEDPNADLTTPRREGTAADAARLEDAQAADPYEEAAQARALRQVLIVFEERTKRGGPYWSRALLHGDIRDMVTEAARRIGVTL